MTRKTFKGDKINLRIVSSSEEAFPLTECSVGCCDGRACFTFTGAELVNCGHLNPLPEVTGTISRKGDACIPAIAIYDDDELVLNLTGVQLTGVRYDDWGTPTVELSADFVGYGLGEMSKAVAEILEKCDKEALEKARSYMV